MSSTAKETGKPAPPKMDLSGLVPYLRRYTLAIILGLIVVVLMGIIGNLIPLATGVITDTLAGNRIPFENSNGTHGGAVVAVVGASKLSRVIPYYQASSRTTLVFALASKDCSHSPRGGN